jgi:integrative and conjugative element protein (TIGR02256 family)
MPGVHNSLRYRIGDSGQCLTFASDVLEHFLRCRQCWWWQREAGGQLFARVSRDLIAIEKATGPRPTDLRTRGSYVPNRRAEQQEIVAHHAEGLHFVGDWHTHRQQRPAPSPRDIESIAECVRESTHNLIGFVLVIVGTLPLPDGLHVSVHDGKRSFNLSPEPYIDEMRIEFSERT